MFQELLAQVLLLGLVVWRVSYALSSENGPFGIFERLRHFIGAHRVDSMSGLASLLARSLSCFECLVVVTGSGAALLVKRGWLLFLISWLAISAVALIIDSLTSVKEV